MSNVRDDRLMCVCDVTLAPGTPPLETETEQHTAAKVLDAVASQEIEL